MRSKHVSIPCFVGSGLILSFEGGGAAVGNRHHIAKNERLRTMEQELFQMKTTTGLNVGATKKSSMFKCLNEVDISHCSKSASFPSSLNKPVTQW